MQHVEGEDLAKWCEERVGPDKIAVSVRMEIIAQVANALQTAHEDEEGQVKIFEGRNDKADTESGLRCQCVHGLRRHQCQRFP